MKHLMSFNTNNVSLTLSRLTTSIPEFNGGIGVVYRVTIQEPCKQPRVYDSMLQNNAFGIFEQRKKEVLSNG